SRSRPRRGAGRARARLGALSFPLGARGAGLRGRSRRSRGRPVTPSIPLLEVAGFAFFAALALTPLTRKLARATGYVDHPDPRKAHARSTPLLGGVAIAGALVLAPILAVALGSSVIAAPPMGLVVGGIIALALGLIDDR